MINVWFISKMLDDVNDVLDSIRFDSNQNRIESNTH